MVTLQAIGNAILVQVDDLIRRQTHRTDLERRAVAEIEALKQVAMPNAEQALKTVRQKLVDMYNGATEDLAEKQRILKGIPEGAAAELVQQLRGEATELEDRKQAIADAMAVTRSIIDSTLQPMIQAETLRDGATAFALLQAEIKQRADRSARIEPDASVPSPERDRAAAEHRRSENALAVFGELPAPPKGIPGLQLPVDADEPALSQLDVLDHMIAHLRYELLRAQRDGDQDSANQIQQALDGAYDHRAGMAFIRPSSAFLRSSYAGTGLQDDPGLAWQNMLKEHARRAWRNKEEGSTIRVIAETDKQFWQNINKIRVDGGGKTNYVLAKDDVGNWYVKSYSTDRTAIFQSARNLALFGAGAALDLNLMERMVLEQEFQEKGSGLDGDKKERLDELRGEQAKAGTPTALSGVYNKYREQYNDVTERAHAKLKEELAPSSEDSDTKGTELGARILAAWSKQAALTAHLGHLDEARLARSGAMGQRHGEMVKLEAEEGEDGQPLSPDVKAQRQAAQIIDALRSVADFEAGLVAVIERTGPLVSSLTTAGQEKTKAEGEYDNARREREGLQKQLAEKKMEIDNKRAGVSSISGDTEETQKQKKVALDVLKEEESRIEEELNGRIEEAKRIEGERKTAFDAAAKAHDAVRQAQQLAKDTVAGIAGALFRDVLEDRQQTVREYETAITYVGDLPSN